MQTLIRVSWTIVNTVLLVFVATAAARADVLEDTELHWEAVSSYLEDGNSLIDPADHEGGTGVQAFLAPLADFSIRNCRKLL